MYYLLNKKNEIFFLFLVFRSLPMIFLGVLCFAFMLLLVCWHPWIYKFIFCQIWGNFSNYFFKNVFLILSSLSDTQITHMINSFILSHISGSSSFNFLRKFQTVSLSDYTSLHSQQLCTWVSFSHILFSIWYFLFSWQPF